MTEEVFKDIMKKIDETDWETFFEKEKQERAKGIERVSNRAYLNWLLNDFLPKFENNMYDDEYFIYHTNEFSKTDIKNERDLCHFFSLLSVVANIQRVKEYYDDRFFEEYEYVFKYDNKFYEKNTIVGQGSITRISQIDKPDFCYIDLDLYFYKEENNVSQSKYKN